MIRIATTQLWVHDQDEALAFYTGKLGWEVRADVTMAEMGDFRWLTVGPPGQSDIAVVLMAIPGPPVMDAATAEQVRDLLRCVGGRAVRRRGRMRGVAVELPRVGVEGHVRHVGAALAVPIAVVAAAAATTVQRHSVHGEVAVGPPPVPSEPT